jgi:teichuronic acid biosynthesis glycosyltransferase TuaG
MSDLVSIIIPYYKKKKFFKKTIDCILRQTHQNFEIILIYDDLDQTDLSFVKFTLQKIKRMKIIINKRNLGAGRSRNIGIDHSEGKFITFLDADDLWKENKLKKQIKFMKKNNISFSYSSYFVVDENGKKIKIIKSPKITTYEKLLLSCEIGLSTVMSNSKLLKKERFPNLKTKEDYLLWLKLSRKNIKMLGIKEALASWRKTDNSLSSSFTQKIKDAFYIYNIFLKFNFIKSIYYIFVLSLNYLKKRYL